MQILPLKSVLFKINLEDCKNHFWRSILKIYLMVSPYRWRCMYFPPYWRSILKIIFFRSSKKILIFFFFKIFFFNFFFFISTIFRIDLQNDFWEKKKLSSVRLEPVTLGLPVLHSASVLPGLLWKESKMSEYVTICVFWWWL